MSNWGWHLFRDMVLLASIAGLTIGTEGLITRVSVGLGWMSLLLVMVKYVLVFNMLCGMTIICCCCCVTAGLIVVGLTIRLGLLLITVSSILLLFKV